MKNLTELVFILDRSGSMSGLESDTIGGFNSMLDKQKKKREMHLLQACFLTMIMNCSMTGLILKRSRT